MSDNKPNQTKQNSLCSIFLVDHMDELDDIISAIRKIDREVRLLLLAIQ